MMRKFALSMFAATVLCGCGQSPLLNHSGIAAPSSQAEAQSLFKNRKAKAALKEAVSIVAEQPLGAPASREASTLFRQAAEYSDTSEMAQKVADAAKRAGNFYHSSWHYATQRALELKRLGK